MTHKFSTAQLLIFTIILSFIIRIISLNQSLWLDEGIIALAVKNNSLQDLIFHYTRFDFHPPGYPFLLWIWTKIFGYSEISLRLPSVLFGVLTIWTTFLLGRLIASNKVGLIAATFLAINPLHIYYSQEARVYSLATLLVSINFYYFLKMIKGEKNNLKYSLSMILVLSTDYLAYLIIPAQFFILILQKSKESLKTWIKLLLIPLLMWLVWMPLFLSQIENGLGGISQLPSWKTTVGTTGIKPLILTFVKFITGRIDLENNLSQILVLFLVFLVYIYLFWRFFRYCKKEVRLMITLWFIVPIVSGLLISFFIPVYSYFRVLFTLIPFILVIAIGIDSFKKSLSYFLIVLVSIIELSFSLTYLSVPRFQRENWKDAVAFLKTQPSNSMIVFANTNPLAPFEYYSKDNLRWINGLRKIPASYEEDLVDIGESLKPGTVIYFIEYLSDITDPNRLIGKKLEREGFKNVDTYDFHGVGFIYKYMKL